MTEDKKYYIYALLNPSKDDEVFYIGKGKDRRVKGHYKSSILKDNSFKSRTIQKYRSLGYSDKYFIVVDNLSNQEALLLEKELIAKIGRRNNGSGPLTNISEGGENPPISRGSEHHIHRLISKGTSPAKIASEKGTHHMINMRPWNHHNSTYESKLQWYYADEIFDLSKKFPNYKETKIAGLCKKEAKFTRVSVRSMFKLFRSNWNPSLDLEWLLFKEKFGKIVKENSNAK